MEETKKLWHVVSVSLAFMALLAMALPATGAEVTQEWVARYNGPGNYYDYVRAIATDSAGNVYVTGMSHGGGTGYDYATAAYDSSGNELWVARYNGPGNGTDVATAIATAEVGDDVYVYVTGYDYTGGAYPHNDYATVAYDADGNQRWVARYNGLYVNSDDQATAITTDSAGNVYVTGKSVGTNYDYATVAYDADGNQSWAARYNGPANFGDAASAIATAEVDGNVYVYVTGSTCGVQTGCDYATFAYNSDGTQRWAAIYNNGPGSAGGYAIATGKENGNVNVYVTGSTGNGTDSDYATISYAASNGNENWVAIYNGPGNAGDRAYAIATGKENGNVNVYVTGRSNGGGTGNDFATIAYDAASGNESWVARYNSSGSSGDTATAITVDNQNNVNSVYVTGWRYNVISNDYATVAYDADGNQRWEHTYNGLGNGDDTSWGIAARGSDVYVTGTSIGSGTGRDYATIKLSWQ